MALPNTHHSLPTPVPPIRIGSALRLSVEDMVAGTGSVSTTKWVASKPSDKRDNSQFRKTTVGSFRSKIKGFFASNENDDSSEVQLLQDELERKDLEKQRIEEMYEERIKHLQGPTCKDHVNSINELSQKLISLQNLLDETKAKYRLKKADYESKIATLEAERNQLRSERDKATVRLEGSLKEKEESEKRKKKEDELQSKVTIQIKCGDLLLSTLVTSSMTVGDTVKKLRTKVNVPEVEKYTLFIPTGKNTYKVMEDARKIVSYRALLPSFRGPSKVVLEFLPSDTPLQEDELKKKATLRPTSSKATLKHESNTSATNQTQKKEVDELTGKDDEGQTKLHHAIKNSNVAEVEKLLGQYHKYNLEANVKDAYGWTPLHCAVSNCTGTDSDDEILKMLLEYPNIDVNVENQDQNTPLHYFCQKFISPGCQELGEVLVHKGANINKQNNNGETPLHKAIFNPAVRILMVKLLVKHRADVNIPNAKGGDTALHYSVRLGRKDLVKILLQAGGSLTTRETKENKTAYELAVALKQEEIAKIFRQVHDLEAWAKKLELENDDVKRFIKEDLYLDTLANTDPNDPKMDAILDKLQIESLGVRLKIKQSLPELKDEMGKRQFEESLTKAQQKTAQQKQLTQNLKNSLGQIVGSDKNENWLIRHTDLEFTKELGQGTYGTVFKGLFQGNKVAIKVLKAVDRKTCEEFKKEFRIMSIMNNPHIVHFYGACLEPRICMAIEYCARGSLYDLMNDEEFSFSWDKSLRFAADIAAGVNALHTWKPPILHRDIKSPNILITKQLKVKLGDFGTARFDTEDNLKTLAKMTGTYAYLAPEVFYGQKFTDKTDVWAAGVIVWELIFRTITGKYQLPYAEHKLKRELQILYQVAEKGTRPTVPESCPPELVKILNICLAKEQNDRPSAAQLNQELESLLKDFNGNVEKWNQSIRVVRF